MKKIFAILLVLAFAVPAFAATEYGNVKMSRKCRRHPEKCIVTPVQEQEMTLGIVQKNVKIGTSQAEVASILGSPNIVTNDADGKETWIYDKISSITSYNSSGFGIGVGGLGGGGGSDGFGGGLLGVNYGKNGGNVQTVQKTLTVVIKFDKASNVESFTYHMSKF